MTSTQAGLVLQHLRRLAGPPPAAQPADAQLVERFTARRDEAAFADLVRRHGPMVLNVCRSVLRHEQDAEDAFQATFLVLARKAASVRQPGAVAGWLYEVAYRVALRAQAQAARRRSQEQKVTSMTPTDPTLDMTLRDLHRVLHEELRRLPEKYRLPLVLCYLEGRSQDEAAGQLGWSKGAFRGRLDRGRKQLRRRLEARGITPSALLGAAAVVPRTTAEALVESVVRSAADGAGAGTLSPRVAALAGVVTRALLVTKIKTVATVVFAIGFVTAAAVWTHQALSAREPEKAAQAPPTPSQQGPAAVTQKPGSAPVNAPQEVVTYRGRVLGPDGKPFAGATLRLVSEVEGPNRSVVRATTGADGRFRIQARRPQVAANPTRDGWPLAVIVATAKDHGPDWAVVGDGKDGELTLRLVRNDVAIQGRILDLQGKPVAGAVIHVFELATTPEDDLTPVLKAWQAGQFGAALDLVGKALFDPAAAGLPESVTTGRDGRFRLPGAGRERLISLSIEGPDIATETIGVVPRPAAAVRALVQAGARASLRPSVVPSAGPPLYGTTFDHVASPSRPVTGIAYDRETHQPLAGVEVSGHPPVGHWTDRRAVTDDRGRYRLAGLPKAGRYRLYARPKEGSDYLPVGTEAAGGDGLEALRVDFAVPHGIEVHGRITDKKTGQPVPYASLRYAPLQGNRHPGVSAYHFKSLEQAADGRGVFRVVIPPGPGVLFAAAQPGRDDNRYTQARLTPADQDRAYKDIPDDAFLAVGGRIETLNGVNAYRLLDPAADAKAATCNFELDPGLMQTGTVLGPDGKPLAGAMVLGLTAVSPKPVLLKDAAFTAVALDPSRPRDLLFIHTERRLAGHVTLRGDEKAPSAVKLKPWGTLVGRMVDADGRPLTGVRVQLTYPRYVPASWMERQPEEILTDRAGRFRAERLIPGMKISLGASAGQAFLLLSDAPNGLMQVSVAAGEIKDLRDLRAKMPE